ncbi:helix-turn-helix transcriptional regulator [Arthrobacter sp. Marseille-P9274]|uniref:helix-turn-helix transcriptional regulator n=1 Tax=Arthrobacter sp. Marseille-P9274 TaxID=2866572 RepID=UPI0021C7C647|nr:helix-turn-helix transcriptional regulator [Arthrobacter sp. Marseille-P9274]
MSRLNPATSSRSSACLLPAAAWGGILGDAESIPPGRLLAAIAGAGGTGKTALLDELDSRLSARSVPVSRIQDDLGCCALPARGAVLVDTAHMLGDSGLSRIHALVADPEISLVVAYRPRRISNALELLVRQLEEHRAPVVLGPLTAVEIVDRAAQLQAVPEPEALGQIILEATGGLPWLVHRYLGAAAGWPGVLSEGDDRPLPPGLLDQLGYELDRLEPALRQLLLVLAVGFDLSAAAPPVEELGNPDRLLLEAKDAGLLLPDGRLVPLLRRTMLETTPSHQLHGLQRALVDSLTAGGLPLGRAARPLAHTGLQDARVAAALERAADRALPTQPGLAAELYDEARAAGAEGLETAARRAQAAYVLGDLDGAGRILDGLLVHDDAPDVLRGADVAAAMWAQRGMFLRGADVYRWLGLERAGASAPLAVVAMVATGDRHGAEEMAAAAPAGGSPTLKAVAVRLMSQGTLATIGDAPALVLPTLIRASDMMTASGSLDPLPELPAALAALAALHAGELDIADSVLTAAVDGGQGGTVGRRRLLLLRAWTRMLQDRPEGARTAMAEAAAVDHPVAPCDELLLLALDVGLARRTDDVPALVRAWRRAREGLLHVAIDLFSLLPLGELMVAAARLRETARLEPHLAEAWSLLDRLGDPPLWAVPLHWQAVQAGILSERPADLAPHAAALVRASRSNHLAAVLAAAGRAWLQVLSGQVEANAVETAARGLATVGLTWDGSRLAGHAAGRAEERRDTARLLACARDLHPGSAENLDPVNTPAPAEPPLERRPAALGSASAPPVPPQPADAGQSARLSSRERDVARHVLAGKTYREIGEAMFISPRTAEHHIARIRRRLGASSRSELLDQLRLELEDEAPSSGGLPSPVP